jgi:hypothetical protein
MQPAFEQLQQPLKKSPAELEALLRFEKSWRNLDKFDSDVPLQLFKVAITLISKDPEMAAFFLKDVLNGSVTEEKQNVEFAESYEQKSPLGELLYTRWIEGLRERWPAI